MNWALMPVVNNWPMTEQAIYDVLGQDVDPPLKVLVAGQGVDDELRGNLERLAEKFSGRLFCVFYQPPIPSLAGVWNVCLRMLWKHNYTEPVLVVNNDVRLLPSTYRLLRLVMKKSDAMFVSAVGVATEQYDPRQEITLAELLAPDSRPANPGGPDFSCFLINAFCHIRFPFDEQFIPAFAEDLDYHRRLMLSGNAEKIFSVNIPYLHYGSQTLKQMGPEQRARKESQITRGSRAYYERKWGGPVNEETFWQPFSGGVYAEDDATEVKNAIGQPTTPNLQRYYSTVRT